MSQDSCTSTSDIKALLSLSPADRDPYHITLISAYFSQHKFFKELVTADTQRTLYTNITATVLDKGETLFRYGDQASTFYFVISGSVDVLVLANKEISTSVVSMNGMPVSFLKASSIGPGGTFGELALIAQRPRAATIVAAEDTLLAVCDKATYQSCINTRETQRLFSTVNKISALLPSKIEKNQLMKLVYFLKPLTLSYKSEVYKVGKPFTHLYMIIEGEVTVS